MALTTAIVLSTVTLVSMPIALYANHVIQLVLHATTQQLARVVQRTPSATWGLIVFAPTNAIRGNTKMTLQ